MTNASSMSGAPRTTNIVAMPVDRFLAQHRGKRTILVYGLGRTELKLLDDLTDEEIAAKLPVHLRHLPIRVAA